MTDKTLLILANSWKHAPNRCIAGREVTMTAASYRLGAWIRPVSHRDEGDLEGPEYHNADGSDLSIGDIVSVSLIKHAGDPTQPENWLIASRRPWTRIRQVEIARALPHLPEPIPDLWLAPGERTDRVAAQYIASAPPGQSICIIRPANLSLAFWSEYDASRIMDRKRSRVRFMYNNVEYDLALTDPLAISRFCPKYPAVGESPVFVSLTDRDAAICVSLARQYNGYHYKIVATLFGC